MTTLILQQKISQFSVMRKALVVIDVLNLWMARHRQRKQLARLDDHMMRDLGLDSEQIKEQAGKPFWK